MQPGHMFNKNIGEWGGNHSQHVIHIRWDISYAWCMENAKYCCTRIDVCTSKSVDFWYLVKSILCIISNNENFYLFNGLAKIKCYDENITSFFLPTQLKIFTYVINAVF